MQRQLGCTRAGVIVDDMQGPLARAGRLGVRLREPQAVRAVIEALGSRR